VLVLAVGIGLLTTISWAASGMLAARSTASQATDPDGAKTVGSTPAQVSGDGTPASPSPSPRQSSAPSPDRSSPAQPRASSRAVACAPGTVTLRVSSPQYWYQPGTTPRFTVHAVSRETQPCRFNMGTKFVSVVVAAGGRRIWSSADCISGGSNMILIARGTPAVLRLSWDRKTSAPGCTGTAHLARPGEYQVTAIAGHLRSAAVNVVLGATGASGP
jgi:hypothetical protein